MSSDGVTAAMRYKDIVASLSRADEDLRAWEQNRAIELEGAIADAAASVEAAREREERATQRAQHWWRMAADNVSRLPWLELDEPPGPDPTARYDWLSRYVDGVKPLYNDLVQAVLQLGWRARR
ncbi:hypothetical protein HUW46_03391 [Amycolatopsis sp. CA-230715]|nr:hypothetical protein [Amycolatopsis sp. CA-230715]QWF79977.1 hypothetical protein HUW46_03391 [Amycolatopsis sp. CA-230715]